MQNDKSKSKIFIIDRLQKDQQFTVLSSEKKTFFLFLIDDQNQEGEVKIQIKGSQANVQILGIIIGSGKQTIRLYTEQDHMKPESISDLLIKSVLFDSSRFKYEGLIKIEKDAQKSNAYQKNQNLLMSKSAWADSRPYLEILANDVRCTHGATVGKIPEDQVYYLKTRGLSENEAKRLIVEGFIHDVLEKISDKKVREKLHISIEKELDQLLLVNKN